MSLNKGTLHAGQYSLQKAWLLLNENLSAKHGITSYELLGVVGHKEIKYNWPENFLLATTHKLVLLWILARSHFCS